MNIKKKLLNEFNLHTIIRMPGSVFAPYTSITTNILFFDNTKPTEETWFYRMDMPEGYKHFSKTKPMKLEHFNKVMEWWNNREEIVVDGFDKAKKFTATQLAEELGYNLDQCGYPHVEEEILDPMDLIQRYQEQRASLNAIVDHAMQQIYDSLISNNIVVDIDFAKGALTRLVEIDSVFPEKMKNSILQLAIQGKLVEQRQEEGTGAISESSVKDIKFVCHISLDLKYYSYSIRVQKYKLFDRFQILPRDSVQKRVVATLWSDNPFS